MSIMRTAYEVPLSLVCVPIWGMVETARTGDVSKKKSALTMAGWEKGDTDLVHHFEQSLGRLELFAPSTRR